MVLYKLGLNIPSDLLALNEPAHLKKKVSISSVNLILKFLYCFIKWSDSDDYDYYRLKQKKTVTGPSFSSANKRGEYFCSRVQFMSEKIVF